ncbi:glycosyltransferase family 4 protein [Paenibacillus spiritus]|uniref:Glycosyltransferase family 4 protein n=1 Tax=Paenibacillus spiritus TaxID=2496557 RepID=A0A5J5FTE6_9BACL|nr:glycosyltransferase [Paenibacillus spiritus]KAA8996595.1 glycosyltransferase family 4 protein [Paenibacillus spiritus]
MIKFKTLLYKYLFKISIIFKPVMIRVIPPEILRKLKMKIIKGSYPVSNAKSNGNGSKGKFDGVNLVGFSRAEMGVGESCRIAARSMSAAKIPFAILDFKGTNSASMKDDSWAYMEVSKPLYGVNIFHINAEQMGEVFLHYGNSLFNDRYNIGFWHWELPEFPDEWIENFRFVDEIWVPSVFVANSISIKSPVPVIKMPHSIEVKINTKRTRTYFNLPESPFLFLTMYDLKSFQDRKNPQASINAFKKAFSPFDHSVGLVIKINGLYHGDQDLSSIIELIGNYNNIYILRETLSRNDTNALMDVADCFISLHRSEGFGLGLAEAMYLGKPVIGTNWSSVTDFMNSDNSCPVGYKLVSVGQDHGPYKADQLWADPDVEHASKYMVRLVHDEDFYKKISTKGQEYIKSHYSPKMIGELMKKRLNYIKY